MEITRDTRKGRLYAGAVLPEGALLLGTVRHPADQAEGALVRLASGALVHYSAGAVRSLHQHEARRALHAATPSDRYVVRVEADAFPPHRELSGLTDVEYASEDEARVAVLSHFRGLRRRPTPERNDVDMDCVIYWRARTGSVSIWRVEDE